MMNISISNFVNRARGRAYLDQLLMPEFEFRFFHHYPDWDTSRSEEMFSINNGEGQGVYMVHSPEGIVGMAHGCSVGFSICEPTRTNIGHSMKRLVDPAFSGAPNYMFFCKNYNDPTWLFDPENTELDDLVAMSFWGFEEYMAWARCYYEIDPDEGPLLKLFNFEDGYEKLARDLFPGL